MGRPYSFLQGPGHVLNLYPAPGYVHKLPRDSGASLGTPASARALAKPVTGVKHQWADTKSNQGPGHVLNLYPAPGYVLKLPRDSGASLGTPASARALAKPETGVKHQWADTKSNQGPGHVLNLYQAPGHVLKLPRDPGASLGTPAPARALAKPVPGVKHQWADTNCLQGPGHVRNLYPAPGYVLKLPRDSGVSLGTPASARALAKPVPGVKHQWAGSRVTSSEHVLGDPVSRLYMRILLQVLQVPEAICTLLADVSSTSTSQCMTTSSIILSVLTVPVIALTIAMTLATLWTMALAALSVALPVIACVYWLTLFKLRIHHRKTSLHTKRHTSALRPGLSAAVLPLKLALLLSQSSLLSMHFNRPCPRCHKQIDLRVELLQWFSSTAYDAVTSTLLMRKHIQQTLLTWWTTPQPLLLVCALVMNTGQETHTSTVERFCIDTAIQYALIAYVLAHPEMGRASVLLRRLWTLPETRTLATAIIAASVVTRETDCAESWPWTLANVAALWYALISALAQAWPVLEKYSREVSLAKISHVSQTNNPQRRRTQRPTRRFARSSSRTRTRKHSTQHTMPNEIHSMHGVDDKAHGNKETNNVRGGSRRADTRTQARTKTAQPESYVESQTQANCLVHAYNMMLGHCALTVQQLREHIDNVMLRDHQFLCSDGHLMTAADLQDMNGNFSIKTLHHYLATQSSARERATVHMHRFSQSTTVTAVNRLLADLRQPAMIHYGHNRHASTGHYVCIRKHENGKHYVYDSLDTTRVKLIDLPYIKDCLLNANTLAHLITLRPRSQLEATVPAMEAPVDILNEQEARCPADLDLVLRRFEKQQRGHCLVHALNNAAGAKIVDSANLHQARRQAATVPGHHDKVSAQNNTGWFSSIDFNYWCTHILKPAQQVQLLYFGTHRAGRTWHTCLQNALSQCFSNTATHSCADYLQVPDQVIMGNGTHFWAVIRTAGEWYVVDSLKWNEERNHPWLLPMHNQHVAEQYTGDIYFLTCPLNEPMSSTRNPSATDISELLRGHTQHTPDVTGAPPSTRQRTLHTDNKKPAILNTTYADIAKLHRGTTSVRRANKQNATQQQQRSQAPRAQQQAQQPSTAGNSNALKRQQRPPPDSTHTQTKPKPAALGSTSAQHCKKPKQTLLQFFRPTPNRPSQHTDEGAATRKPCKDEPGHAHKACSTNTTTTPKANAKQTGHGHTSSIRTRHQNSHTQCSGSSGI